MENKIGDHVPSVAKTQAWASQVEALRAELDKFTIKLSPAERQHHAQPRIGGEAIAALIGGLSLKYGIQLPDMPIDGMNDDLALAQRLGSLLSELSLLVALVEDTIAQARSEAWQAATGHYSVLSRMAAANPSLAKELEPLKEFFARRRKAPGTPTGATGGQGPAVNGRP